MMPKLSWLPAAALTFAASIHCVGMCGGFVAALGGFRHRRGIAVLLDQILLQVGKAASYAFLGAVAGALGAAFLTSPSAALRQRLLLALAGAVLAFAGLTLLGLGGKGGDRIASRLAPAWHRLLSPLLQARPPGSSLLIGMAMGFLPCPLVYAGLAAALASGEPASGALIMAGVALGTVPALLGVALFGFKASPGRHRILARGGGALLLLAGISTFALGWLEPAPAVPSSQAVPSGEDRS